MIDPDNPLHLHQSGEYGTTLSDAVDTFNAALDAVYTARDTTQAAADSARQRLLDGDTSQTAADLATMNSYPSDMLEHDADEIALLTERATFETDIRAADPVAANLSFLPAGKPYGLTREEYDKQRGPHPAEARLYNLRVFVSEQLERLNPRNRL